MTLLFSPIELRTSTVRNRIGMSPMSMYSAIEGRVGVLDAAHYGARAIGGTGLVFTGTVAVSPEGRITPRDPGLWEDGQVAGLCQISEVVRAAGGTPAIQIGHAGRKASTSAPWHGGEPRSEGRSLGDDEGGWPTLAPTALAFGGNRPKVPAELATDAIQRIVADFATAAERADRAGFDALELHGGHGYLLHEFYSPLTNQRGDEYGGSFENRVRFPLEVVRAIRRVWPEGKPLAFRLTVDDFVTGGWGPEDGLALAKQLVAEGVDLLDLMSFGGLTPEAEVPWDRNFTAEHGRRFKEAFSDTAIAVSAQTAPAYDTPAADIARLVDEGAADIVLLGRQLLTDPHYAAHAATALGHEDPLLPSNYEHWLTGRPSSHEF
ncbi:MAG: hypothetical protein AAGA92_02550 [Planctomycetota bacterium]